MLGNTSARCPPRNARGEARGNWPGIRIVRTWPFGAPRSPAVLPSVCACGRGCRTLADFHWGCWCHLTPPHRLEHTVRLRSRWLVGLALASGRINIPNNFFFFSSIASNMQSRFCEIFRSASYWIPRLCYWGLL